MEKKYIIGIILVALLTMTMSVSANTNTIWMSKGIVASANWNPAPNGGYTYITVTQAIYSDYDLITDVDVAVCDASLVNCGEYTGDIPNSAFKVKGMGSLKETDLSSVTLPLYYAYAGSPPSTITIDAIWTGVGDITKSGSEYKSITGDSIFKSESDSSFRLAMASGTDSVHGSLGASNYAFLNSFSYATRTLTKP